MPAREVELHTGLGVLVVELYFDHAPRTCNNFYELAKCGYYNGTIFHRVIKVRGRGRLGAGFNLLVGLYDPGRRSYRNGKRWRVCVWVGKHAYGRVRS